MSSARKRVLLGHLASNGDCLYATAIARQIKMDYPGCHLTWAVGSPYKQAIDNNPDVDEIWDVPFSRRDEMETVWRTFAAEARRRRKAGEFDEIFLTQINPDNYGRFDGTVRASIFRSYPRPISVPVTPTMRLRDEEVNRVRSFADNHRLREYANVILFECAAASSQSFVSPPFAQEAASRVVATMPDTAFILSSNMKIESTDRRIIDGSVVPFRENAELTKYCTLLVGASSGISWLATSDWAKPLPKIQLLSKETGVFASMLHDAEHFGLPIEGILEMTNCSSKHLAECIIAVFGGGFSEARQRFHQKIDVDLTFYIERFMRSQLRQGHPIRILQSMSHVARRYGARPFLRYMKSKLDPKGGGT